MLTEFFNISLIRKVEQPLGFTLIRLAPPLTKFSP